MQIRVKLEIQCRVSQKYHVGYCTSLDQRIEGFSYMIAGYDHWSDPAYLVSVLEEVNHPAIGINWDVYHPVRRIGLSIDQAHSLVKPWLKHVHFHDGIDTTEKLAYMPTGTGAVDHRRIVELNVAFIG